MAPPFFVCVQCASRCERAPRPLSVRLAPDGSGQPAMLLDKDGKDVMTVDEHNDKVRTDVAKTISNDLAGIKDDMMAKP